MFWIIIIAVIGYFVYKNFFKGQEQQTAPVRSNCESNSSTSIINTPKEGRI